MKNAIKAQAKVNLFLNVVGKRSDGYHLLESLFIPVPDLYDDIIVEPSNILEVFTVEGPDILDNIVLKVANKLRERFSITKGAKIIIKKRIPVAAGLGGGSSDAAAALRLLCQLWDIEFTGGNTSSQLKFDKERGTQCSNSYISNKRRNTRLTLAHCLLPNSPTVLGILTQEYIDFAASIGADVPFFTYGKPAFIQGIGEIMTPVDLGISFLLLLVNPGVSISTAEIFKMGFEHYTPTLGTSLKTDSLIDLIYHGKNDLQPSAIKAAPAIQEVLTILSKQRGCIAARMSGSGATCFGIFSDAEDAENAKNKLPPEWWSHNALIHL